MTLFRNPEFLRHARAQLRPVRALSAGLVALALVLLTGLICWAGADPGERAAVFFRALFLAQGAVLLLWTVSDCGQAIAREREQKTFDFVKTTALTPAEIIAGKLFGAPVLGYFVVACTLPFSLAAALIGRLPFLQVLLGYGLVLVQVVFWSLVALWLSMLADRGVGVVAALVPLLIVMIAAGTADAQTVFGGLASLCVPVLLGPLFGLAAPPAPVFFGWRIPLALLNVFIHGSLGAWFALMLVRNVKKDAGQRRMLSNGQSVGLAVWLNVLFYACLNPALISSKTSERAISADTLAEIVVGANALVLILIGLAVLLPAERLKNWRQQGERVPVSRLVLSLPWTWQILAAVCCFLLLSALALALSREVPIHIWQLRNNGLRWLVLLAFIGRDVLFVQWCLLTGMKRPIVKGVLFIWLYYFAATIAVNVAFLSAPSWQQTILPLVTPFLVFDLAVGSAPHLLGAAIQVVIAGLLVYAITRRVRRPAAAQGVAAGA